MLMAYRALRKQRIRKSFQWDKRSHSPKGRSCQYLLHELESTCKRRLSPKVVFGGPELVAGTGEDALHGFFRCDAELEWGSP